MRTYAPGMLTEAKDWELFDRLEDPDESKDVSAQNGDVFEELRAEYLRWLDAEVGGKPDPLRIEAAKSSAANSVKRRFEMWQAMSPRDRGDIDDRPS